MNEQNDKSNGTQLQKTTHYTLNLKNFDPFQKSHAEPLD